MHTLEVKPVNSRTLSNIGPNSIFNISFSDLDRKDITVTPSLTTRLKEERQSIKKKVNILNSPT